MDFGESDEDVVLGLEGGNLSQMSPEEFDRFFRSYRRNGRLAGIREDRDRGYRVERCSGVWASLNRGRCEVRLKVGLADRKGVYYCRKCERRMKKNRQNLKSR